MSANIKRLTLDGGFAAVLVILGMIKIPSAFAGTEYQLSASYAVCLASIVGFRRYFKIGICASMIQLLLGTHTIWDVVISMVFRIVAGGFVQWRPNDKALLILAGPLGTGCARIVLAMCWQLPALPLLTAAVPGMIFTMVCVPLLMPVMKRGMMVLVGIQGKTDG